MSFLRTLTTRRLIVLIVVALVVAAGGTAIAVAARAGGPTPPPKPLDQAIHDALAAPTPEGITARVKFTNNLFPSGALLGSAGSAMMSGASGRLWATNDGRGRIELQSDAGDAQIVWDSSAVSVYDASSNTVYRATLPAHPSGASGSDNGAPPALSEINAFLAKLAAHATVSAAQPTDIAGRPAYKASLSPKHDGGLLASAELAWDAEQGVPLRIAVFAQGSSSPVLELTVTDISYGSVPATDVNVQPPAGAKTVDLGTPGQDGKSSEGKQAPVTGLPAVQAAAGFPVIAPDTLVGLPRQDVRLIGGKTALVAYGHGLGAIIVVERTAEAVGSQNGPLSSLPTVSLDGVSAHELSTQLGTVIAWQRGGTAYVLTGSLPAAAAEAAARQLK
jgi:outer membrane lipoprotein-sorting protein